MGAVGMCFTGGFALAMMTEPSVVAPVLSQPSMPAPIGAARSAGIDASPGEIACVKRRFADEGLSMIGLRFKSDRASFPTPVSRLTNASLAISSRRLNWKTPTPRRRLGPRIRC